MISDKYLRIEDVTDGDWWKLYWFKRQEHEDTMTAISTLIGEPSKDYLFHVLPKPGLYWAN